MCFFVIVFIIISIVLNIITLFILASFNVYLFYSQLIIVVPPLKQKIFVFHICILFILRKYFRFCMFCSLSYNTSTVLF